MQRESPLGRFKLLALTLRVAVFLVGNVGLKVTSWGYISGSGCCDWVEFQKIGNIYYSNNKKDKKKEAQRVRDITNTTLRKHGTSTRQLGVERLV
jgi:hypothetical protein